MTAHPTALDIASAVDMPDLIGRLSPTAATPLYLQLQIRLRNAIVQHVLPPGAALPAERLLAEAFDVSRITVRKAMEGLVAENLIVRRRGMGAFVLQRMEKSFSSLSSFSQDMAARGRRPGSHWLNRSEGIVSPEEAMALGLSPGEIVCRFQRLRFADDNLVALEFTCVPMFCLGSIDVVEDSLYAALEKTGHRPVRALQRLRAVALTPDQAESLKVKAGAPGLFIERRSFLADGRSCELNRSYYRGDGYDIIAETSEFNSM